MTHSKAIVVRSTSQPKSSVSKSGIVAILSQTFGLSKSDKLKLSISDGFMTAHVKHADGNVTSHVINPETQIRNVNVSGSANKNPKIRRKNVAYFRKLKRTQQEIANLLGVSQATISLDLKALGMK